MDPRVFTVIAAYLGRIQNKVIWPFLAPRPVKLGAVSNLLIQILVQASAMSGGNCTTNDDCDQNEACIDRTCVPRQNGLNLVFAPADEGLLPLGDDAKAALDGCFVQIYEAMVRGLVRDPRNLSKVKDLLMSAYASALTLTGGSHRACSKSEECNGDEECVDGVCVPIPFQLKFQPEGAPPIPPWPPEGPGNQA